MCLITPNRIPSIATEDMMVYKILNSNRTAVIQPFHYELEKLYTTELKEGEGICADGISEDKLRDEGYTKEGRKDWSRLISIGEGFHSCRTLDRAKVMRSEYKWSDSRIKIYLCIIPKGSMYYTDNSDLVVSNQIIIKHELSDNQG